jgi:hypothetical protein
MRRREDHFEVGRLQRLDLDLDRARFEAGEREGRDVAAGREGG